MTCSDEATVPESGGQEQQRAGAGEETLDSLEDVLHRIQEVTGEEDVDLLVTRFIQGKSLFY